MKLLITGGSGFLGRRAAAYYTRMGQEVFAPSHAELDITDEATVLAWFRTHRPDAVFHTAAVSDIGMCDQDPVRSQKINVDGSVNLAKACAETGAKLAFCSSDQVYFGSTLPGPHREDEPVCPGNLYGRQKLQAERECLAVFPETVCLRLSWMYSAEQYAGAKEHGHLLTILADALQDETKTLTWPIHDCRGITNADYVIQNLTAVLGLPGGVYNYGSPNTTNTYETMRSVFEASGLHSLLARLTPNTDAFSDEARDLSMDLRKIESAGIRFPSTKQALTDVLKNW